MEPSNHMKISMQNVLEKFDLDNLEVSHPSFKSLIYTSLVLHGILTVNNFKLIVFSYKY